LNLRREHLRSLVAGEYNQYRIRIRFEKPHVGPIALWWISRKWWLILYL
jgi:hypothetical protein